LRLVFLLLVACLFTGCAGVQLQSTELRERLAPEALPAAHVIPDVPFIEQAVAQCGPASLAMVLNFQGSKNGRLITADEIAKQVYTPGMKGSFQQDLVTAARRQGYMAVPISGFDALIKEIDQNHPVVVFENLGVSWYQQWHYAVVFGYDLAKQNLTMHSGTHANEVWGMRRFEQDWMYSDYWGLVVLKPGELSASADEMSHSRAAAALEELGQNEAASKSYAAILARWPDSLTSAIGLANLKYAEGAYKESVRYLKHATDVHPFEASVWHNLAIAQVSAKETAEARKSAQAAIRLASPSERAAYLERLAPAL
jgi:tetratricopeptide (TPR) repeat protein